MKVIVECGLLSDAQKRTAAEIAAKAGAAFVKTSTGFLGSGATIHDERSSVRRSARGCPSRRPAASASSRMP